MSNAEHTTDKPDGSNPLPRAEASFRITAFPIWNSLDTWVFGYFVIPSDLKDLLQSLLHPVKLSDHNAEFRTNIFAPFTVT